jgi:hypothetical protein
VARSVSGSNSARTLGGCDGDAVSRSGGGYAQQCLSGVWEVVEHGGRLGRPRASAAPPPHPLPYWYPRGGSAQ